MQYFSQFINIWSITGKEPLKLIRYCGKCLWSSYVLYKCGDDIRAASEMNEEGRERYPDGDYNIYYGLFNNIPAI